MSSRRVGLSLLIGFAVPLASAQTVVDSIFTLQGAAGYYDDPNNWSPPEVPNNSPGRIYNVTVPGSVYMNVNAAISNLNLTVGAMFSMFQGNFVTSNNFTNNGTLTVRAGIFTANGALTNFDPVTRTLTGGMYELDGGYGGVSFVLAGADIVNNAASISLLAGGKIFDRDGNDGLRNFAHNLRPGIFRIDDSQSFTAASDFTNAGTIDILGSGEVSYTRFIIPPGHQYLQTEGATSLRHAVFEGDMEIARGFFGTSGDPFFGAPAVFIGDLGIGDGFCFPSNFAVRGTVHLSQNSRFLRMPREYDTFSVTETFTADGILLIGTPQPTPPSSSSYAVVQTNGGVIGRFRNAANGARVPTTDGLGSFVVSYTSNSILLSDFRILPSTTRLLNISTRVEVGTGANVLIGGFIITGTQPKRIIVRALGPSLSPFFAGILADPVLELHDATGNLIVSNDNWRSDQESEIIATGIPPTNNLESAIVMALPAHGSAYTAVVRGANNGTGLGIVEAYDLDQSVDSKQANISTRGFVETGNNVLIAGLIMLGQNPLTVIVRAIGPSLSIPGALIDPTLSLHNGDGELIAFNDNWRSDQEAEIIATGIPPSNDLESAIVTTLPPAGGSYTAIAQGKNGTSGVALVEVYDLDR